MRPLNFFYEEPNPDRFFPLDRYPRHFIRRLIRGKSMIRGQKRVFLNLCAGLDLLGIPYQVNDYRYIQKHPEEVACIIGKPFVLDKLKWKNPILFGAAVFSHPCDDLHLFERLPVSKILVPGEWMRKMFKPYYGDRAVNWAVGIDTAKWQPAPLQHKHIDVLLYDKVLWEHDRHEKELIKPIRDHLARHHLTIKEIRYGFYKEEEFHTLLLQSKAMIFLCEHETQGIAYQQALSCGVPILAWDQGGFWKDPSYFPNKVKFAPVSSVPYWDDRCGIKFRDINEFPARLEAFLDQLNHQRFAPRNYIIENLTLEKCAQRYVEILNEVQHSLVQL
jgi:hypothetical protein